MFPRLRGAKFDDDVLFALGEKMISAGRPISERKHNPEESDIPAGYTYLGQFISHDLTFDPASSLQRKDDPTALFDYRSPCFDLDCIYGRGPDDQPYMYRANHIHFRLGERLNTRHWDVPRDSLGMALIADPRNDENVIISQLQGLFLRFHNCVADVLRVGGKDKKPDFFWNVQQSVRWHYQWMILHDFLPRIVNEETYNKVLPHVAKQTSIEKAPPQLRFYKLGGPRHRRRRYIPIEFSAAAGRFGHAMVRPAYRLNRKPGIGQPFAILSNRVRKPKTDLRGFERFQRNWAVQWDLFFAGLSPSKKQKPHTMNRVQPAYKIDTSLSAALGNMPFVFKEPMPSLAARNMIRGSWLGLPSGQAVARALHEKPLSDEHLRVYLPRAGRRRARHIPLTHISASFRGKAPLWFYILAEAQHEFSGAKLGCVGGRIVMETFVGLMLADRHCFLNQNPGWKPELSRRGKFGMAELVHQALSWRPPPGND
jgi:Animal haem peroxidase